MMAGLSVLLRKELREQVRTSRILVVGIIFLAFGLLSPILAKYTPQIIERAAGNLQITVPTPTVGDSVDQILKNLGQIGPFAAILLAMGEVARERERGTAAFVLTKPVSRPAFLAAKFIALIVTLGIAIVVGCAAGYFYTAILFSTLPLGGYLAACALLLLSLLVYAAITFLASTLVPSALPAGGIGLAAFVLIAIIGGIPHVKDYTPNGLFTPAHDLALGLAPTGLAGPLLVNLAVVVVALALSWLAFRRQEIGS